MKLHDYFAEFLKASVNINATRLEQLEGHERALAGCLRGHVAIGPMVDLFITLLTEALPDQATAAQCADPMNVMFDGVNPDTEEPWMFGEATAIGWGASRTQDGENGLANYGGGDLKNYPVEVLESKHPIRIDSHGLLPDSGGTASAELRLPDGTTRMLLKISHTDFPAGSSLRVITGGGGGYGDPLEREPELIDADLADGYVTAEAASAQYRRGGAR